MFGFSCCWCTKVVNIFPALVLCAHLSNQEIHPNLNESYLCDLHVLLSGVVLDLIELLQHNLTQTISELESCTSLKQAAQSLQDAAEKQTQGCQSGKQFLQKQL